MHLFEWLSPVMGMHERKLEEVLNVDGRQDGAATCLMQKSEFVRWMDKPGTSLLCFGGRKCFLMMGLHCSLKELQRVPAKR